MENRMTWHERVVPEYFMLKSECGYLDTQGISKSLNHYYIHEIALQLLVFFTLLH
jgi:hypothetical protein